VNQECLLYLRRNFGRPHVRPRLEKRMTPWDITVL
jgi:hypothetical protein